MNMRERRKGSTQPRVMRHANVRWNKSQLVGVANEETDPRSVPESVQSQMLTALVDANKLLRGLTIRPGIDVQVRSLSCNAKAGPTRPGWAHMRRGSE
jgi:hypothetical protein